MEYHQIQMWEEAKKEYLKNGNPTKLISLMSKYKEDQVKSSNYEVLETVLSVLTHAIKLKDESVITHVIDHVVGNSIDVQAKAHLRPLFDIVIKSSYAKKITMEHLYIIYAIDKNQIGNLVFIIKKIMEETDYTHSGVTSFLYKVSKQAKTPIEKEQVNNLIDSLKEELDINLIDQGSNRKLKRVFKTKTYKKGRFILVLACLFVLTLIFAYDQFVPKIVDIDHLQMSYGDTIDRNQISIRSGIFKRKINSDVHLKYDKNKIGSQTATLRYGLVRIEFRLTITPRVHDVPDYYIKDNVLYLLARTERPHFLVLINEDVHDIESFSLDLNFLEPGDYRIRVKMKTTDEKHSDSAYSEAFNISRLNEISNLQYENGKLTWHSVSEATSYGIWINNRYFESTVNELLFNFTERSNIVRVQSKHTEDTILDSNYVQTEFTQLVSVTNIRYQNNQIIWNSTEIGYKYIVTIGDEVYETTNNYLDIHLALGSHQVAIKTVDDSKQRIESNEAKQAIEYTKIETPSILVLDSSSVDTFKIAITNSMYADQYEIVINKYSDDVNYITDVILSDGLSQIDINIENYVLFKLSVKAKNILSEAMESDFSDEIEIIKLSQTQNIIYEDGKLKWDLNTQADAYIVWINDDRFEMTSNEFTYHFLERDNIVRIQSVNQSSLIIDSNYKEVTFTKLASITNIRYQTNQILWDSTESEYLYVLTINGTQYQTENKYLNINLNIGIHDISIQVVDPANQALKSDSIEIQIGYNQLNSPSITLEQGVMATIYILSIDAVEHAESYELFIQVFNESTMEWENTVIVTNLTYQFNVSSASTKIIVTIVAKDNEGVYADSNQTVEEFNIL